MVELRLMIGQDALNYLNFLRTNNRDQIKGWQNESLDTVRLRLVKTRDPFSLYPDTTRLC
jgi:hypothetical protein